MIAHPGYYADLVQQSLGKSTMATEEIERDLHRYCTLYKPVSKVIKCEIDDQSQVSDMGCVHKWCLFSNFSDTLYLSDLHQSWLEC